MTIIPFDMASDTGYVNSTEKEYAIGIIGITDIPTNTRFREKRNRFLYGKVQKANGIEQQAMIMIVLKIA